MLKVVHDGSEPNATSGSAASSSSLLDEIVRDGARQMLAAALQAEVAAYIEAHRDQVDEHGRRLVVRNGYHAERGGDHRGWRGAGQAAAGQRQAHRRRD
jgi:putative transposase